MGEIGDEFGSHVLQAANLGEIIKDGDHPRELPVPLHDRGKIDGKDFRLGTLRTHPANLDASSPFFGEGFLCRPGHLRQPDRLHEGLSQGKLGEVEHSQKTEIGQTNHAFRIRDHHPLSQTPQNGPKVEFIPLGF